MAPKVRRRNFGGVSKSFSQGRTYHEDLVKLVGHPRKVVTSLLVFRVAPVLLFLEGREL